MKLNLLYMQQLQNSLFTLTNMVLDLLDCKVQRILQSGLDDRRTETRMKSIDRLNISSGIKIAY
jgi:hypothetical protein